MLFLRSLEHPSNGVTSVLNTPRCPLGTEPTRVVSEHTVLARALRQESTRGLGSVAVSPSGFYIRQSCLPSVLSTK